MLSLYEIAENLPFVRDYVRQIYSLQSEMDRLKSSVDVPVSLFDKFQLVRQEESYLSVFTKPEPLITIYIPTYNRADLLLSRSVRSVLEQTYSNIQLLVIGDQCSDNTEKSMAMVKDSRVQFVNLPERGSYPDNPSWRWMVAGTKPMNFALDLAEGDFICQLDDDDEFLPERLEKLVQFMQKERCDVAWHPFLNEVKPGRWRTKRCQYFRRYHVTNSSVLSHGWFRNIKFDPSAFRLNEPGDWNRFRKFVYLGASFARYPDPLVRHFSERTQLGR